MQQNLDSDSERDLCRRAARGDAAAQEALYRRHAGPVYTLALRMLCHPQAAEEVLQDTFVKALGALHSFRGDAALATWLHRVAVNECLQVLRSPWRRRAGAPPDVAGAGDDGARRIDLQRALARLCPTTRAVVWLHDVEGYTHREIAAALGRSVSFSKSRLARGHRTLRASLTTDEEAAPCMPVLNNS